MNDDLFDCDGEVVASKRWRAQFRFALREAPDRKSFQGPTCYVCGGYKGYWRRLGGSGNTREWETCCTCRGRGTLTAAQQQAREKEYQEAKRAANRRRTARIRDISCLKRFLEMADRDPVVREALRLIVCEQVKFSHVGKGKP